MLESRMSLLPAPYHQPFLGGKIFFWLILSLILLICAFCTTAASLTVNWVYQGDGMSKWEGDLRRITTPGVFWEMYVLVKDDGDEDEMLVYSKLAKEFCEGDVQDTFTGGLQIFNDFMEYSCDIFDSLDNAGWYYVFCCIVFFILVLVHLSICLIAFSGRQQFPRWTFISNATVLLIVYLAGFLFWVWETEVWFDNECEQEKMFDTDADICSDKGLSLALASLILTLLSTVIFVPAMMLVGSASQFQGLEERNIELSSGETPS